MAEGNMRACGCHRGRPCTCELGRRFALSDYACGTCVNCLLNARAVRKHRRPVRKCVQYDTFVADQQFDRLEIASGCVLRMRKPDWDVHAKSVFYTQMRQLRLGLAALRASSALTIDRQRMLRKKYNRDLAKTQEALQRVEASRNSPSGAKPRRVTADVSHVDSDVFDSYSKQLIPAETLLPDLLARLAEVNETIATEERNLQLVEVYVSDVAVRKLQATVRESQRARRWKQIWWHFREDAELAAAVVIQSTVRMAKCRPILPFLRSLQQEHVKLRAAECLRRFLHRVCHARRVRAKMQHQEALIKARQQKDQAAAKFLLVAEKIVCRMTILKWRDRSREATAHDERKVRSAAIAIQRQWRGLRDRLNYQRIRYRRLLSDPVRSLYDKFVCHGDLWRLLFDVDAAFRRYEARELEEKEAATTFVAELVRDKREYEDRMMQQWFTASALDSPVVRGAKSTVSAFAMDEEQPEGFSLAQAILQSPLTNDLVALSPKKSKTDVFPDDLSPEVIRQATYEGFSIADTIAVMRGLIAQGKATDDPKLVMKVLKSRAPLTLHPWKRGQVQDQQPQRPIVALDAPLHRVQSNNKKPKRMPAVSPQQKHFLSDNMIDNVPGGLRGSVDRLVFVAALKCFDPDAPQSAGRGAFVFQVDSTRNLWRSYVGGSSPLMKIRREQIVQEAIKPHVLKLKENRCFTAFDILHNVRGIDDLVSWGIPRPLVMSIYDVIELLHTQTVNRSDRNIFRQTRVSAQFEAYLERHMKRSEKATNADTLPVLTVARSLSDSPVASDEVAAMNEVAVAIERDVLELPLRAENFTVGDLLFKAHFLLCHTGIQPEYNNPNKRDQGDLSKINYRDFLSEMVRSQLRGDSSRVKELVQRRMRIASDLSATCEQQLAKYRVVSAHDLKLLCESPASPFHHALQAILKQFLVSIPEHSHGHLDPKGLKPELRGKPRYTSGKDLAPLSPLIRQSRTTVDSLDDTFHGIDIPF